VDPHDEIQVLVAGEWTHPWYGDIIARATDLQEFVDNFNSRAFGQDLALDLEHGYSAEGAPGWFQSLRTDGQALYASIEWTDLGEKLLGLKRFRYFSPEYYFTYKRSSDGRRFRNVLAGGALTNRPFFKELTPLVGRAGTDGMQIFCAPHGEGDIAMSETAHVTMTDEGAAGEVQAPALQGAAGGVQAPALQGGAPELATVRSENAALRARVEAAERETTATRNLALGMQRDLQRRELVDRLAGLRFGAAQTGELSPAQVEALADIAVEMSEAPPVSAAGQPLLGEDGQALASPRARFVELIGGLTVWEPGRHSFVAGDQGGGLQDPMAQFNALATKIAADRKLGFGEAVIVAAAERPDLAGQLERKETGG